MEKPVKWRASPIRWKSVRHSAAAGSLLGLVLLMNGCAALKPSTQSGEAQAAEQTTQLLVAENQEDLTKLVQQNRELREQIGKLEQKLTALNDRLNQQKADIQLVQEQWEMNFVLLERSVSEALAALDETSRGTAHPEIESGFSRPAPEPPVGAQDETQRLSPDQGHGGSPSVPPVETITLFESPAPQVSEADEDLAALNNLDQENPPPEDEDPGFVESAELRTEDLEETEPLPEPAATAIQIAANVAEKPVPVHVPEVPPETGEPAYQDPDLNDPLEPIILIRHPGVKKIYNQGMTAVIQRNYEQAIRVFENYVQRFPNDMDSDNAYYWIGHAYFQLLQFEKAEASFRAILTAYEHRPTSQGYKTPDAIYMLGKIHEQRGLTVETKYYYREVSKRYPGSAAAKNAERDLKLLP